MRVGVASERPGAGFGCEPGFRLRLRAVGEGEALGAATLDVTKSMAYVSAGAAFRLQT